MQACAVMTGICRSRNGLSASPVWRNLCCTISGDPLPVHGSRRPPVGSLLPPRCLEEGLASLMLKTHKASSCDLNLPRMPLHNLRGKGEWENLLLSHWLANTHHTAGQLVNSFWELEPSKSWLLCEWYTCIRVVQNVPSRKSQWRILSVFYHHKS